MLQRRLLLTGCVFVALLGVPREGRAGIVEVIIEMSGPQMLGFGGECKFDLQNGMSVDRCKLFPHFVPVGDDNTNSKYRFSVEAAGYFSTGQGNNADLYDLFEVWMLAVDPMVEARVFSRDRISVYIGAGASYNLIFNTGFNNLGFKVRPFALTVPFLNGALDLEFNVRLYPKEFTPEDFGELGVPPGNEVEVVNSFSAAFRF